MNTIRPVESARRPQIAAPTAKQAFAIRDLRAGDDEQHRAFLHRIDPRDMRQRLHHARSADVTDDELHRLTHYPAGREIALIAVGGDDRGGEETLGVVRAALEPELGRAELGVLVRSDCKRRGIGGALLRALLPRLREAGVRELHADVLDDNPPMLGLARAFGFVRTPEGDAGAVRLALALAPAGREAAAAA